MTKTEQPTAPATEGARDEKKRREGKTLSIHGRRGDRVRAFITPDKELARVHHLLRGRVVHTRSWPATPAGKKEAMAYAEAYYQTRATTPATKQSNLTLLEVWQAYQIDQWPHLRPRTQQNYTDAFDAWMLLFGEHFLIERTTLQMAARFRAVHEERGLKVRTIRGMITNVKIVYRWAETQELLMRNRLALYVYKVAKEKRPKSPEEYRDEEFRSIHGQLNPALATQWRAWVALALCRFQGARQNAVLHLKVTDLQLGHAEITDDGTVQWVFGRITWRPEWDKMGVKRDEPLRLPAQIAVEIALEWHERTGCAGPWLFPSVQQSRKKGEPIYDGQSLWWALKAAEKRAGITRKEGRAGHGLRKLLAGDVHLASDGDFLLALRAIGDTDPRRAVEYVQKRNDRLEEVFTTMDTEWAEGADE